ncbi:hypothetical protein HYP58_gp14 [Vibrio phage 1.097.O._10N.286.49.B3]|uniref:Uncharacterized protein n=1 Tax=Vibrio phage 1.097.O._10N.286.49.B3 TaxID=1881383 RepID=A0A2I7R0I5_9CAUD|nr:hypothetical protein HYP58_gp14 [Vibrio phage 1.097.O._10N.286.49.B3]AUR87160.1 hypothetical protein NVP1097O_14 [Vibrio phage 1.097.O._10N.286.49.B3]
MSECINVALDVDVGTTINSPNFFSIEETVSPGTTIADIEAGILTGEYTPIDPNLYTYEGCIKSDYGQAKITDLDLSISTVTIEGTVEGGTDSYNVVTFKVPPSITKVWDNKGSCLLFDIKRTEIADATEVDIWVKGKLNVFPIITE